MVTAQRKSSTPADWAGWPTISRADSSSGPVGFRPSAFSYKVETKSPLLAEAGAKISDDTIRFRPVHSVMPEDAAKKINLTKCFCFNDQTLLPKQRMELPVVFTVGADLDPEIDYITMNYTLFGKETNK